jgi:hypothetical protein
MELTDLAPLEAWAQIEKESFKKFNLQSSVFNTDGIRITETKNWANKICPEIKSTDKGQKDHFLLKNFLKKFLSSPPKPLKLSVTFS